MHDLMIPPRPRRGLAQTGPMDQWRLGHRPGLDGLRGVAIALVFVGHGLQWWRPNALGSVGVTIFFTLSGFLITSLLLQDVRSTGRIRWGHFYARRARRLLPALIIMVILVGLFQIAVNVGDTWAAPAVLGYGANYARMEGVDLGFLGHAWSLAVEEQFYLFWPPVVALAVRRVNGVLVLALAGVAISIALRFALWDGGAGVDRAYYGLDTRADALLVGCALAALVANGHRPSLSVVFPLALLGAVLVLVVSLGDAESLSLIVPTIVPWLTAGLVLSALGRPGWLAGAQLAWWGQRSYGIYLWHFPLMFAAYEATGSIIGVMIAAGLSLATAEASWRYVEQPILRGRSRDRVDRAVRAVEHA